MSVIYKKVGNKKYAYLNYRENKQLVQKYLGACESPEVYRITSIDKESNLVPQRFKPFFWDTGIKNIDPKQHRSYIIARLLEFGDLDSVEWLRLVYPGKTIINTLLTSRTLSDKSKNFWLVWFGLKDV